MSANSKASPHVNGAGFDAYAPLDPAKALVPATVRVNEQRVTRGFWPKFRKVAAQLPFACDVLAVWFCARDPQTPTTAKGMVMAALAYFVLPVDAIPDILPVIGYTDDAAVLAAVVAIIGRNLKDSHREAAAEVLARMNAD
jgi:uncharacterized membrane protein YkvA (DUF1232 family)